MKNSLYNRRHLREYLIYGVVAALVFIIPSWIFLSTANYENLYLIFLGSVLFMAIIGVYSFRLSRRRAEYKSTWMMIIATHFAILAGIIVSVILTTILCFFYIPGFLSGDSYDLFLNNVPAAYNRDNVSLIMSLYACATIENFGAGGFIGVLGPYVFKINQTKDKAARLETNIPQPGFKAG